MPEETTSLLSSSVASSGKLNSTCVQDADIDEDCSTAEVDGTLAGDIVVYKSRWFILVVFSLLSCFHFAVWNTWGPIADTAKTTLNWTDGNIALLANWACITFVLTAFLFSYLLLYQGLRFCVLCSALFLLAGAGIRCIPVGIENVKWTMHVGQICIGISSPVLMAGPTKVSAVWFPPRQRTTATAISTTAGFLGLSLSFLVGPMVVSSVPRNASSEHLDPAMRTLFFHEIMHLMYIECGAIAVVVISALLYFPEKPPTPPSFSATKPRDSFKDGTLMMIRSRHFWLPAVAYSLSSGIYDSWMSLLVIILHSTVNDSQNVVGWIGFFGNIAAVLGGVIVSMFMDLFGRWMKAVLILFAVGSCLSTLWCVLIVMQYIPYNLVSVYIACMGIGVCVKASVPIYFELTVEGMYPVSEGNITMVMTYLDNTISLVLLFLPLIPNIGVMWMNWTLLGSTSLCLPLILMYKERYNRLDAEESKGKREN